MGTRSNIIVKRADGKFHRIYTHWDGYLSHMGAILQKHYNSQKKAESLVSFGDISSIGPSNKKPKGHTFDKPREGYTVYYGRDRGENDVAGLIGDTFEAVYPDEFVGPYIYYWNGSIWMWWKMSDEESLGFIPLKDALKAEKKGE